MEGVPQSNLQLQNNLLRVPDISTSVRVQLQYRVILQENRALDTIDKTNVAAVEHLGNQERPQLIFNGENADELRQPGFSWTDTACILGVSTRTLRKRCQESGDSNRSEFSNVSNDELDSIVREILHITPQAGQNIVQGAILGRGLRIQRRRIELAISNVEPVNTTLHDQLNHHDATRTHVCFCHFVMINYKYICAY